MHITAASDCGIAVLHACEQHAYSLHEIFQLVKGKLMLALSHASQTQMQAVTYVQLNPTPDLSFCSIAAA